MRRKIFFLSLLTVLGLGIITVFIYFQTGKLSQVIQVESAASVDLLLFSDELIAGVNSARFNLAAAFVIQTDDTILEYQSNAQKNFENAYTALRGLQKFNQTEIGNLPLEWKNGEEKVSVSFVDLVSEIESKLKPLESSASSLFVARSQNVKDTKELLKIKTELSKVFRASGDIKKINPDAYPQLSRAVFTALSSQSTRDLQFAGRKILDDTKLVYEKNKIRADDKINLNKVIELTDKTLDLATKVYASSDDFSIFNTELETLIARVEALKEFSVASMKETQKELLVTANTTRTAAIGTSLVVALLCLFIGFLISKNLITSLSTIVSNLSQAGDQVTSASNALEQTSTELSGAAQRSSASLEETSASLTEISSMTSTNAKNAENCAKVGKIALELAESGQKEVSSLTLSMNSLAERSKKIEDISVIIEDIAFQTNLLALNAAVEAARAGEHGKGFAVVADAVRSLAQRSAESAKIISTLIHESVAAAQESSQIANRSEDSLKNIFSSVTELSGLSESISEACKQQANGIFQIQKAVEDLERGSRANADSASETTESSGTLSTQAQNLNDLVKDLENLMGGSDTLVGASVEQLATPFKLKRAA